MGKASRRKSETAAPPTSPAPATSRALSSSDDPSAREAPAVWFTLPLAFILAAAAIFRVAYFFQYRARSVFFDAPFLDAWLYHDWARRIAAGEWSPTEPFYFAPGYPYLLAILYRLISPDLTAVYVFQFALGLLNIVLIHRLAARAFSRSAATMAAALAALYASFPFLEAKVMSPTAALTLLLVSLLALSWAAARGGAWRYGIAGALLGATSLARPETLLAGPFFLAWIAWIHRRGRPAAPGSEAGSTPRGGHAGAAAAAACLLFGWTAAIAPAALHNIRTGGGSTLISSQGGITFYQSNNPRARGLYVYLSKEGFSGAPERQALEEKEIAEKAAGRPLTRSEVSSYWFGRGLDFIRGDPGRFIWLLGMKLLRFVGSYEYSTEYVIYVERETVWLLWLPFVPFALIVGLAAPSLAGALAGRTLVRAPGGGPAALNADRGLLLAALAANLAAVLTFYVSSRYRLPSLPPLLAFAGATIASAAEAHRAGRRAQVSLIAASIGLLFALTHFERDASATIQEANVHYNSGNLWTGKNEHERAVAEYRRAIAMDGSRYQFWYNMANSLRDLGRIAEAAEAYGEAARRRPDFWSAHVRQGQMLVEMGEWARAREPLEKALAMHAGDFDAHLALGRAAARLGDREAALKHLDRALEIRPGSEAARAERARL